MRLISFAAAWLAGLYAASLSDLPIAAAIPLIVLLLPALFLLRRRWRLLLLGFAALGLLAGLLRYEAHEASREAEILAAFNGRGEVELQGVIDSYPEERGSVTQFRLKAEHLLADGAWRSVSGRVLVTARQTRALVDRRDPPYFHTGDRLALRGALEAPKPLGDFDFPAYLDRQGVRSVLSFPRLTVIEEGAGPRFDRGLFALRSRLAESLEAALPEPQSGLAKAILLGIRSDMPESLEEDFNRSGTTHLLAISGQNVSILLAAVLLFGVTLLHRSRRSVYLAALALVWGYALLAGLPPSAFRAAVMGSLYIGAMLLGRQRHGLESLLLSAVVITLFAPSALWQVSFHLSFLAMAGIVLLMPWAEDSLAPAFDSPKRTLLSQFLRWAAVVSAMSVAAALFTWPAIAFYFHRVSLATIPATVLASPALPVAMVASALAAFIGLVSSGGAWLFGWLAWLSLSYTAAVAHLFASLPLSSVTVGEVGRAVLGGYYAGLALLAWLFRTAKVAGRSLLVPLPRLPAIEGPRLSRLWWAMLVLLAFGAVIWTAALWPSPRHMHVTIAVSDGGTAIIVQTPSRHVALIDAGGDGQAATQALGARLGLRRRVDVAIATSPRAQSIGGMAEAVRRYSVTTFLAPTAQGTSAAYAALEGALAARGVARRTARPGDVIRLGEVTIEVLHAPTALSAMEDDALVLAVRYRRAAMLVATTARSETLERVPPQAVSGLPGLLVMADARATAAHQRFIAAAAPQAIVLTPGRGELGEERIAAAAARAVPQERLVSLQDGRRAAVTSDGRRVWIGR